MEVEKRRAQSAWTWVGLCIVVAAAAALWGYGAAYYTLPFADRPQSPLHSQLNSARPVGNALGIIGTLMILLLLLYSLRKRVRWLQSIGTLRQWLSLHTFLGLMGPLLITFHTGFKVGGLVSIAYWSMIITMLSGIFGRYIYSQLPRDGTGTQLSTQDLREEEARLNTDMSQLLSGSSLRAEQIHRAAGRPIPAQYGGWRVLTELVRQDVGRLLARYRLHALLHQHTDLALSARRRIVRLALQQFVVARRRTTLTMMDQVFHHWHVLHKPFVWIMLAVVALHIGVALLFGYAWY